MDDRITELERRLALAEQTIAQLQAGVVFTSEEGFTVKAPLRVVDEDGHTLVEVSGQHSWLPHNEIRVFNKQGVKVAALGDDGSGGYLAVRNHAGALIGYLSIENEGARLIVDNNEEQGGVVLFGKEEGGGLNISSKVSTIELWTTSEGSQIEVWRNEPLEMVIGLIVSRDDRVEVRNKDGGVLLSLP